jgi:tyrosyl-tRNA synthetase
LSRNVYHILKDRGFIYQTTDDKALEDLLENKKITHYVGFDATADSLHIGSLVPIMAMVHMQQCGHRAIALIGGGTTLVGDPSGKTEMRKMLTRDQIDNFGKGIKTQLNQYLSFKEEKAVMLNNADWLTSLNYIEFLRDIGRHFSVNRMLTAESYKMRLETGLSFIEFNYMLLQAYDFYILARDWECELQMGGQDQWGNIVAGVDLTRRMINKQVYGITFPLLMNASGDKFGKTVSGAVWLSKDKTSTYDFYQFWRNVDDADVFKCLGLFTFLSMDEVKRLTNQNINRAKEILAYEVTKLAHGKEEADQVYSASVKQFGSSDPDGKVETSSDIVKAGMSMESTLPTVELPLSLLEGGLCSSNGEVRRLIKQGGAYLNEVVITDDSIEISPVDLQDGALLLRAGKKRYKRVLFV